MPQTVRPRVSGEWASLVGSTNKWLTLREREREKERLGRVLVAA